MRISVVIPLFNEQLSLEPLYEKIAAAAAPLGDFEVIFVDDGSTDKSWEMVRMLVEKKSPHVKGLRLRRNFGKAAALTAGFKSARGEIIFTMDADLQDDPVEMPRFVEKLESGYDLVSGWKKVRHDPLDKTFPSKFFNWMICAFSGVKLHDFNCGYKAYRREVVESLPLYGELHRFIPVFAHADGFRVGELDVHHHPRKFGKSKYGFERFMKGFLDLLSVAAMTKFGRRPGHLFGGLGVITGAIGFFTLLYLWINQLMGHYIEGRPLFFFGIMCMILSAQMVCSGVLAELFLRQSGAQTVPPIAERKGFNP